MDAMSPVEREWLAQGYAPWSAGGPFVPAIARIFQRQDGAQRRFRIEVTAQHCNGGGRGHGGFIAMLADVWLASALAAQLAPAARFVTASLQVDFLEAVRPGDCLESEIDWFRPGSRLCHASGRICSGGRPVAAMRGVFAILPPLTP
jgi:uncharacterized protein (TIGR00369 family)